MVTHYIFIESEFSDDTSSKSILAALQELFARMQLTNKSFVSPVPLYESMIAATGQEPGPGEYIPFMGKHECQEFFNVLYDRIENGLSHQKRESLKQLLVVGIQNQLAFVDSGHITKRLEEANTVPIQVSRFKLCD